MTESEADYSEVGRRTVKARLRGWLTNSVVGLEAKLKGWVGARLGE